MNNLKVALIQNTLSHARLHCCFISIFIFIFTLCVPPVRSDQQTDQGHYVDPREAAEPSASAWLPEHSRGTPGLLHPTSTNSLEYSKASGLSSSGYELSQYMNGAADQSDVDSQSLLPPPPSCFEPGRHTAHRAHSVQLTK